MTLLDRADETLKIHADIYPVYSWSRSWELPLTEGLQGIPLFGKNNLRACYVIDNLQAPAVASSGFGLNPLSFCLTRSVVAILIIFVKPNVVVTDSGVVM